MRRVALRSLVLVPVVLGLLSQAAPVSAGPPIDLPRLPIDYDYATPMESHGYWVGTLRGGEWRVVGSQLSRGDRLTLDVEVRPPAISVPLESGPAVLFGRLGLTGGLGGDVGAGAPVPRLVAQVLPACPDPTDCVYRGSITLPTHLLPRLAERARAESWSAAEIGLTLVRTFARGTWLQVLPLYDELRDEADGSVARPRRIRSQMLALGAAPVGDRELWSRRDRAVLDRIERLRRSVDDPSRLPDTQPLLVDIETAACTPGWTIATATGDVLIDVKEPGPAVPVRVEAPVGAAWTVSVPSIDRAQGTGDPPHTYGPFRSDVPGLVSGSVSGDPYLCEGVEPGSVSWRPATDDEVASFAEGDPADVLDTYATLPGMLARMEGGPWSVQLATSPFERLWQPLDPADVPFEYVCEPGLPFTTSDLASARGLDDVPESLADAVSSWAERISSATDDWTVAREDDGQVLALAPGRRGWMESMRLVHQSSDTWASPDLGDPWDFATGGDCQAQTTFGAGRWRLDHRFPAPGPRTRTLHVVGYLGCNGTEKSGPAHIHTTDDAMLIAIPMRSTMDSDMCHGIGPTRMTIRLPKPLGDRVLYDAGSLPIRRIGPETSLGIKKDVPTKGQGG